METGIAMLPGAKVRVGSGIPELTLEPVAADIVGATMWIIFSPWVVMPPSMVMSVPSAVVSDELALDGSTSSMEATGWLGYLHKTTLTC